MTFPWFALTLNFALLGAVVFISNTLNVGRRGALFNGALIFMIFCLLAMVLDLALTYVFASATTTDREQYIGLSSLVAYGERVLAYLIPGTAAGLLALRFRARQRHAAPKVVIQTSEYTQSELPT